MAHWRETPRLTGFVRLCIEKICNAKSTCVMIYALFVPLCLSLRKENHPSAFLVTIQWYFLRNANQGSGLIGSCYERSCTCVWHMGTELGHSFDFRAFISALHKQSELRSNRGASHCTVQQNSLFIFTLPFGKWCNCSFKGISYPGNIILLASHPRGQPHLLRTYV